MRRRNAGQAAVEALAAVPLFVVAALLIWQMAAVASASLRAEQHARERALTRVPGGAAGTVHAEVPVPALLPGLRGLRARAAAGVPAP